MSGTQPYMIGTNEFQKEFSKKNFEKCLDTKYTCSETVNVCGHRKEFTDKEAWKSGCVRLCPEQQADTEDVCGHQHICPNTEELYPDTTNERCAETSSNRKCSDTTGIYPDTERQKSPDTEESYPDTASENCVKIRGNHKYADTRKLCPDTKEQYPDIMNL